MPKVLDRWDSKKKKQWQKNIIEKINDTVNFKLEVCDSVDFSNSKTVFWVYFSDSAVDHYICGL